MTQVTATSGRPTPKVLFRTLRRSEAVEPNLPDTLLTVGIAGALGAVVLQTILHFTDVLVFDFRYNIINPDSEQNIPNWGSASTTFVAAVAALLLGLVSSGRLRARYLVLAAILAFFSLDDAVGLHELFVLGTVAGVEQAERFVWPLLYLPLLVAGLLLLVAAARRAFWRARVTVLVGLAMLVAAVAVEYIGGLIRNLDGVTVESLTYAFPVTIEEGLELAGWMLIATGLLAAALERAAGGPEPRA